MSLADALQNHGTDFLSHSRAGGDDPGCLAGHNIKQLLQQSVLWAWGTVCYGANAVTRSSALFQRHRHRSPEQGKGAVVEVRVLGTGWCSFLKGLST